MAESFLKKLDRFPPVLCRLLAVRHTGEPGTGNWPVPLTDEEIAEISGLPLPVVKTVAFHTEWDSITVGTMKAFIKGCRLNLGNWGALKRIGRIANRGRFGYLRRSDMWAEKFNQLVAIWEASCDRG